MKGSHTGKRYRIRSGRQMNVDQLDEGGHLARISHTNFARSSHFAPKLLAF